MIEVQRSPEDADTWWSGQGQGELLEGPGALGLARSLPGLGQGYPVYPSIRPLEPHTFNGCVLFSCDFNSVELTFKMNFKTYKKVILMPKLLTIPLN